MMAKMILIPMRVRRNQTAWWPRPNTSASGLTFWRRMPPMISQAKNSSEMLEKALR